MIVCLLTALALRQPALKLSPLFSDNMVLQRDIAAPVFGVAEPHQAVTVTVGELTATTKADDAGKWIVRLPAMKAGGPFVETVKAGGTTLTINNVMVGEVWLCSGQSNMERPESSASDYSQAMEEADPAIRMFTVGKASTEAPAGHIRGAWVPASRTTVGAFSAVALAFGRELHSKLGVPIGLIHASWGGTRAEAWLSRGTLRSNPVLKPELDAYLTESEGFQAKNDAYRTALKQWIATRSDKGNLGYLQGWAQPHVYETDWKTETLPGTMETMEPQEEGKQFDGAVWFRRTFDLPEAWEGKALKIQLGPIRDYDDTYVNGTKVGTTKEAPSDPSLGARSYRISPGIPVHGVNSVAIRVFSAQGVCGFTGLPDQMNVTLMDGSATDSVPLAGPWQEKVEVKVKASDEAPHMPIGPGSPKAPGGLFNGMIAPLIPYGVKGVIWYQGESDAGQAAMYRTMFPALIHDWREKWGASLPFYFVQLANYKARQDQPSESDWAELREAQASALKLLHTGMATTIDIGDAATIHPTNKREVGRRLSLIALSKDYSMHVGYSGPEFQSLTPEGASLRVFFKHIGEGLKTTDGRLPIGFAIAGDDHKFYWATAKIQGSAVVVSSPAVPSPVAVRYGWADNPDCNLTNSDGLPAVPFRTDTWTRVENK